MKLLRFALLTAVIAIPRLGLAQMDHPAAPAPTEAQKVFKALKALSGDWVGTFKTVPQIATGNPGDTARISLRALSRGNTLVHEMHSLEMDPSQPKTDHP